MISCSVGRRNDKLSIGSVLRGQTADIQAILNVFEAGAQ